MKKITSLILVSMLLIAMLTGCSNNSETSDSNDQTGNFAPENTAQVVAVVETVAPVEPQETLPEAIDIPVEESSDQTQDVAADEPDEPEQTTEPSPTPDTSLATYTFQTLSDTSFGFVFTYPSNWVNYPGKHTVCFREPAEDGSFPARVAITKKKLVHKPDAERVLEQFQAYGAIIREQYDTSTFEWGTLNTSATFMGRTAYEIPYLAYSGDTEIQGYLVCTAVDYTIYVYHFYCAYPEYDGMKNLMTMMRDSVKLVE